MACISLPTAALISGGLGAVGSIASGVIGAGAAQSAAATQAKSAKAAQASTLAMYNANKDLLSPFTTAGTFGATGVEDLLGGNGMDPSTVTNFLKQLPGYQFSLDQGLQATQSGYAAQGLAQSGPALKGAADYAEGLAGTTYQNLFGNFLQTAGLGENAASSVAGFGTQAQQQLNSLITGQGAAQAAGTVGAANSITGGIGSAFGSLGQSALLMGLYGGNTNKVNPAINPLIGPYTGDVP